MDLFHDFVSVLLVSKPGNALRVPNLKSDTAGLSQDGAAEFCVGVVSDVASFVEESVLMLR
jgi:hypothetical protein